MAEIKTKVTEASVPAFLDAVENPRRRADGHTLLEMFQRVTGQPAKMWGPSIIGFGQYHYRYDSGREGDMCMTGFSPRKANMALYIMPGFERQKDLLGKLGKHKTGKSCLYINKLDDVDMAVLEEMVTRAYAHMAEKYES